MLGMASYAMLLLTDNLQFGKPRFVGDERIRHIGKALPRTVPFVQHWQSRIIEAETRERPKDPASHGMLFVAGSL